MNKEDKLERIMERSRKEFIRGLENSIKEASVTLLRYSLYKSKEEEADLKRFFHSLKGTGATLNLKRISSIAGRYEDFISDCQELSCDSKGLASILFEGLSEVYAEVLSLIKEYPASDQSFDDAEPEEEFKIANAPAILIVDDDLALLDLLDRVLRNKGYRVFITGNSSGIVQILKEERIDLVILDIMMPGKNGFEVLEQIREEKFSVPVMILSGETMTEERIELLKSGKVEDYLAKPFKMKELVARISRILEKTYMQENDNSRHILLVDDVSIIIDLLKRRLTSMGYKVSSAENGEQGVIKCRTLMPDLMVVDLMLPKMDGFEVCRRIKCDPETKDIKIIVLTSRNSKNDVLKCFQIGVDDYIIKPFSLGDLENRINLLLNGPRS